ncbi:protein argonaute-4-like isoform X2 [Euwallacea similis]|uniref:protein argonaute-4-like isoform X2 n=1 Tax=Euwallacea similis TaxID=1736056 RepID=UPI00344C8CA2
MGRKAKKINKKNIPAPAPTTTNASSPATPEVSSESTNVPSPGTHPRNLAVLENRENPKSDQPDFQQPEGRNQGQKDNQGSQKPSFDAPSRSSTTVETLGKINAPPLAPRPRDLEGQSPPSNAWQGQERSQGRRPDQGDKWGDRQASGRYQRPGYGGRPDDEEYSRRQGEGYNQRTREVQQGRDSRGQQATESRGRPQPQQSTSSISKAPAAWGRQPVSEILKSPIKREAPLEKHLQRTSYSGVSTEPYGQVPSLEKVHEEIPVVYKEPGTLAKQRIKVQSNHFAINLGNLKEAYQYDVKIQENQTGIKQEQKNQKKGGAVSRNRRIKDKDKLKVMNLFLERHFPGRYPAFDGSAIMYASKPLDPDLNHVMNDMDVVISDHLGKPKSFNIEIRWVKLLDLKPLASNHETPVHFLRDVHQCIEVIFKNAPSISFTQIGRGYFRKPEGQVINLGGGLEMYHGFTQSVVMGGQWEKIRPMLNLHLAHKDFHKNQGILETFMEILNDTSRNRGITVNNLSCLENWQLNLLKDCIVNLKVSYQVPHFPRMTYKVRGLGRNPMEEKLDTGITIFEYFKKDKKYTIKYPKIPLLKVGGLKSNIMIPPELCVVEKDQSGSKKLNDFVMRNMIKMASTDTKTHRENTMRRFRDSQFEKSPHLREFGFSVSDKFEVTDARVLPPPSLLYGNNVEVKVDKGVWRNENFLKPKKISKWAVLNLDSYVKRNQLDSFVNELIKASKFCGTTFESSSPDYLQISTRSRSGFTLMNFEEFFKEQKQKSYDIIFVILPGGIHGNSVYANVKYAAEIAAGCLTQCIKSNTLYKMNTTTAINILLKDNGKLNGTNYSFSPHTKPLILEGPEPFMLLGADVTHPEPNAVIPYSIAAIIASHDLTGFHYNMKFRFQPPKKEEIEDFKNVVKEQLSFFYEKNSGKKPAKIIYFRDGVAEGHYSKVKALELAGIINACKEMQLDGYEPKIAFLVVQKRHHTRLFPVNDKDSVDVNFNVPPGTCVDTNIVNPGLQNFYLLSHASIKGTSRPTKYTTIYDDINMSNDEIQELAYYLCHMFARCTRSVSYPAPTYYAHLGALRAKAYLLAAMNNKEVLDLHSMKSLTSKFEGQFSILNYHPMFFI